MKKSGFKLIKNVFSGVSVLILTTTTILSSSLVYGEGDLGEEASSTPEPSPTNVITFSPVVLGSDDDKNGYTMIGETDVTIQDAGYVYTDVTKRYEIDTNDLNKANEGALKILDLLGFIHEEGKVSVAQGVKNEQYFRHASTDKATNGLSEALQNYNYDSDSGDK